MMPSRKISLIYLLLSTLSVMGYLLISRLTYRVGFPLDDAWIHLTYARNLATHGEWAFVPGQASAGSTAPLWSALLAIGFSALCSVSVGLSTRDHHVSRTGGCNVRGFSGAVPRR